MGITGQNVQIVWDKVWYDAIGHAMFIQLVCLYHCLANGQKHVSGVTLYLSPDPVSQGSRYALHTAVMSSCAPQTLEQGRATTEYPMAHKPLLCANKAAIMQGDNKFSLAPGLEGCE